MNYSKSFAKRRRTRFNSWQIQRLEQVFLKTHYPNSHQMDGLAIETNISTPKMQIWFQNRRAKWRKNSRLKNFGGLEMVKDAEYLPAPHKVNTFESHSYESHSNFISNEITTRNKSNENKAIDLRLRSLSGCQLSSHPVADESSAYKKSGGITSTRITEHMNAFEYPTTYYSQHYSTGITGLPSMTIPFASNQSMTSLLFASHLYSLCIQSDLSSGYEPNVQNIDSNK